MPLALFLGRIARDLGTSLQFPVCGNVQNPRNVSQVFLDDSRTVLINCVINHSATDIFIIFFKLNHSAKWEEVVDSNLAAVGTCDHVNTDVD